MIQNTETKVTGNFKYNLFEKKNFQNQQKTKTFSTHEAGRK